MELRMSIKKFVNFYNSIKVDEYIEKVRKPVYHYTSPAGLKGIVENGTFRFTDRFYLNDKTEGVYVLNLCVNNIKHFDFLNNRFKKVFIDKCNIRIKQPQRNNFYVYQCCFSVDKDSLCLWNYYTKSEGIKGYNLKINTTDLPNKIKPELYDNDRSPKLRFGKVIYDKIRQLELLYEIIKQFFEFCQKDAISGEQFICDYLVDKIMHLGTFFKMDCFEIEHEYRLVFDLFLQDDGTYAVIKNKQKFYEKNGVFVPCVDISFEKDLLIGIGVSPTLDYCAAKKSVLRMTGSNYENISSDTIYESQIPVRY
ncbi:MAG: DUF2971 domain-containing protein [Clostridia bacterium]|nr:DUF2971 domain-containing protein [Clostridia bacterium]